MSSVEEEIIEIEKYIKSLEINDDTNKEINATIQEGMEKGLIYDFFNANYRATMFSSHIIKKEEFDDFQNYINRCEKEEFEKFEKWKEDIISSGNEYSIDEFKYNKLSLI